MIFTYHQGRPSRGFQGGMCTPAFLPSPGNSYIRKEIVHAFYFPWNSPPHAPLLSRLDGRPCISYSTLDHFWATWPDSHLTFSKIACYLRWESKGPGPKGLAVWAWAKGVWGNGQRGLSQRGLGQRGLSQRGIGQSVGQIMCRRSQR